MCTVLVMATIGCSQKGNTKSKKTERSAQVMATVKDRQTENSAPADVSTTGSQEVNSEAETTGEEPQTVPSAGESDSSGAAAQGDSQDSGTAAQGNPQVSAQNADPTTELPQTMAQKGDSDYVSFLFAGDVCLEEDGFVLDYYDEVGQDLNQCVDPNLQRRMAAADIFMLNHEYTISARGSRLDKYYTFRADPSRMHILQELSVDLVSLANNHIYDYGYDAFADTIALLDQAGIRHVGGGLNQSAAEEVVYYTVKGVTIGVVSASRAEKYVITPKAEGDNPGVFWMYDETRLLEVAADAATRCDYLVAYLHWGTEDSKYFENYQHRIAEELENVGVDAIIGGHPHVVQGMEYVNDMPVLYSMGDFWFNGEDKYSIMVQLDIYKDGSSNVEIIPCRQQGYAIHEITDDAGKQAFFSYLSDLSPGIEFYN